MVKYILSETHAKISFWLSWAVIFIIVIGGLLGGKAAEPLSYVALPSMSAMIVCLIGIRGYSGVFINKRNQKNGNDD